MIKCPNCNHELIEFVEGSAMGMRCPNCQYEVATSYFDPIDEDETIYEVFLAEGSSLTKENYFVLNSLTGLNMTELRELLLHKCPYKVFSGYAYEVKELRARLDKCNIKYMVEPDFSY